MFLLHVAALKAVPPGSIPKQKQLDTIAGKKARLQSLRGCGLAVSWLATEISGLALIFAPPGRMSRARCYAASRTFIRKRGNTRSSAYRHKRLHNLLLGFTTKCRCSNGLRGGRRHSDNGIVVRGARPDACKYDLTHGSSGMVPNPPYGLTGGYESCVNEHRGPMERLR